MVKREHCWPWLDRRGLQSTAKCSSAAPEARRLADGYGRPRPGDALFTSLSGASLRGVAVVGRVSLNVASNASARSWFCFLIALDGDNGRVVLSKLIVGHCEEWFA